jgi:hypothetical protein
MSLRHDVEAVTTGSGGQYEKALEVEAWGRQMGLAWEGSPLN